MKGDFSRLRYNGAKHYTSVLQQQGRVALDADANEQCAINERIRATETIDIVGPFGGPSADAGFAVTVSGNSIQIGAGRYYVEGLLCESASPTGYLQQPLLINPPFTDSQLLSGLQKSTYSAIQVFLEVWQRLVTSLDDVCLLEPALGQADTTARLQTVWRVVAVPVPPTASTVGSAAGSPADCCVSMYTLPPSLVKGRLSAQTTGDTSDCGCQPTPAAGYRGLENQLYRVEIQQGGTEAASTFKWSRENGSVVVGVTQVSGSHVLVESLGLDANLGFAPGQWVEITDDSSQFGVPSNQPGQFCQIQSVTPAQLSLTVAPPVVGIDTSRNARLRRWDQFGASAGPRGVPLSSSWLDLENGIQVQFTAGAYTPGDYWLIPARTASGQIDWPPCGDDSSAFQPPRETTVFRAPLACIHWTGNQQFTVEDCRRLFPPLTGVAGGAAAAALHVTGINWGNDDVMTFDRLLANGLTVTLDQAPTGLVEASTFSLTLEVLASNFNDSYFVLNLNLPPIVVRTSMPLDGQITVQTTNIAWNLPIRDTSGAIIAIQVGALNQVETILLLGASYGVFARARVRLQGRDIFAGTGSSQVFLDGQAFGTPGLRTDGRTPRIDLTFPSGAAAKASDFESWFFLAPALALVGLSLQPASVVFSQSVPAPPSPVGTLTVNYPALADTIATLSVVATPGSPAISIGYPVSVVIPKGKTSVTFSINTFNTGVTTPVSVQIVASMTNALGTLGNVTATLTVTGYQVIF